jgi:hypothetical protein
VSEPSSTANSPVQLTKYPARSMTSLFDLVPLHTCIAHRTVHCAATCLVPNSPFFHPSGSRKRITDADEDGLALQLEKAVRCLAAARRVLVFYCCGLRSSAALASLCAPTELSNRAHDWVAMKLKQCSSALH